MSVSSFEIGDARVLIDLMDRRIDQAEFDDGANVLDETRIRRAAAGRQRRDAAGDGFDRIFQRRDERSGFRQEDIAGAGERQIVFCAELRPRRAPPLSRTQVSIVGRVQRSL